MSQLTITDNAARRIQTLAEKKGGAGWHLRITVDGGGCAGFQYKIEMDDQHLKDDVRFAHQGVEVVVDETSLPFLAGSVVDYVEKLGSAAFEIQNPQSTSSCGCGSSFSIGF